VRAGLLFAAAVTLLVGTAAVAVTVDADGDKEGGGRIDDVRGAYSGVAMGDSRAGALRILGDPSGEQGFAPAGALPAEVGVPQSLPGPGEVLSYEDVALLVGSKGVYAIMVTKPGAATTRGVAIGDGIKEAQAAYSTRCMKVAGGESLLGGQELYPSCGARVGSMYVWFGRDPIRSITLVSRRHSP
jgi:hypothetical protein